MDATRQRRPEAADRTVTPPALLARALSAGGDGSLVMKINPLVRKDAPISAEVSACSDVGERPIPAVLR